jgi:hypothetical protein
LSATSASSTNGPTTRTHLKPMSASLLPMVGRGQPWRAARRSASFWAAAQRDARAAHHGERKKKPHAKSSVSTVATSFIFPIQKNYNIVSTSQMCSPITL